MNITRRTTLIVLGVLILLGTLAAGSFTFAALAAFAQSVNSGVLATATGSPGNGNGMMGRSGMMGGSRSGSGMMGGDTRGATGDFDKHFIEQMIPHHQAAVDMADLALQRATHSELRTLAGNIKQAQTAEIDQMRSWYRQWYGTDVPGPNSNGSRPGGGMMGGRGMMGSNGMMGGGGGMMGSNGMMNGCPGQGGDLDALRNAADFDKAFVEQMIPHHQMGVMMSSMLLGSGDRPELRTLAQSIITSQSAEIQQMRSWYRQWYGSSPR